MRSIAGNALSRKAGEQGKEKGRSLVTRTPARNAASCRYRPRGVRKASTEMTKVISSPVSGSTNVCGAVVQVIRSS